MCMLFESRLSFNITFILLSLYTFKVFGWSSGICLNAAFDSGVVYGTGEDVLYCITEYDEDFPTYQTCDPHGTETYIISGSRSLGTFKNTSGFYISHETQTVAYCLGYDIFHCDIRYGSERAWYLGTDIYSTMKASYCDDPKCQTANCTNYLIKEYYSSLRYGTSTMFVVFSILLTVITILLVVAIFVFTLYDIHQTSAKYVGFISNKPSYFPLYISSVSDIIIFTMICFWAVKLSAFDTNAGIYCTVFDTGYNDKCVFENAAGFLWLYLGILIAFKSFEFIFGLQICRPTDCLCMNVAVCCNNKSLKQRYWRRKYWIDNYDDMFCGKKKCRPFFIFFFKAFIVQFVYCIITMIMYWMIFSDFHQMNNCIKLYEVCSTMMLIFAKMVMQLLYSYGKPFNEKEEIPREILFYLSCYMSDDNVKILQLYLPIFYNPVICDSKYLLLTQDTEQLKLHIDDDRKGNMDGSEDDINTKINVGTSRQLYVD